MRDPVARTLERSLLDRDYVGDGVFRHQFGDATAWGLTLFARRTREQEVPPREHAVLDALLHRERHLLAFGARRRAELEEAALGILGLIAAFEADPRARDARRVGAALTLGNAAAHAQGGVLRVPQGAFDATSVTAALAYGNLRWSEALGARGARYRRAGHHLLGRLFARRVDPATGLYQGREEGVAEALPNLLVAAALARAGRAVEARELLDRAARDLRRPGGAWLGGAGGALAGPVFLSIQNFAAFARLEIARQTGQRTDVREAVEPLSWCFEHLFVDGRLKHDLSPDGKVSKSYCTGCNLQTLAIRDELRGLGAFD